MQRPYLQTSNLSRLIQEFGSDENSLTVGGIPLPRIERMLGVTPFYAYDRALVRKRAADVRKAFPAGLKINYAIKANPMYAVVHDLAQVLDGFDCASAGEMTLALNCGTEPTRISFAGPGKSVEEISRAVASQVTIVSESRTEIELIAEIGQSVQICPNIMLRVNPDYSLTSGEIKMGGVSTQFGVDVSAIPSLLARIKELGLNFLGFYIFAGSQILDHETLEKSQHDAFALASRLMRSSPLSVKRINIGGGFGIPYYPEQAPLNLELLGKNLETLLKRHAEHAQHVQYEVEFGRYLVGEAGVYVCRVLDRKVSKGETYVVTNGGMHHHLAASGNFGGVFRRNYPIALGNRLLGEPLETVTITGRLCTPLDVLGRKIVLPRCNIGDLVVIFQSGAYGLTASPGAFLGHPPPPEIYL
jgi:diaminopimelate decarboxylase